MSTWINLEAPQGNDTTWNLQVLNNGVPMNLTGCTLKLYVKMSNVTADGDSSTVTYTVGSGLTVVNAIAGKLTFTQPHTANQAKAPGTYWWRLDITDSFGNVGTALDGNLYTLAV